MYEEEPPISVEIDGAIYALKMLVFGMAIADEPMPETDAETRVVLRVWYEPWYPTVLEVLTARKISHGDRIFWYHFAVD